MPEPTMSIVDPADDLPRTFKRERALREKAAREQEQAAAREPSFGPRDAEPKVYAPPPSSSYPTHSVEPVPATVRAFDVPFLALMAFFLKAAVAAIPALILLGGLIVGAGKALQIVAPDYRVLAVTFHMPALSGGAQAPARTAEAARPADPSKPPVPALVKK